MTAETAITGNLPTIFVGIVDEDYTEGMWKQHVERISHLFHIDDPDCKGEIMVKDRGPNAIDGQQLGLQMTNAIDVINSLGVNAIRLVGLGIHGAPALHQALESLVRGWNAVAWNNKTVQFVALGDSETGSYLNFCKALCLQQLCGSVQFYNTMDYNDYGFLDLSKSHLEGLCPHQLGKLLGEVKQQNSAAGENSRKE